MDELGYAVVGCGRVSGRHCAAAQAIAGARLVAVADPDPSKAARVAAETDADPTVYSGLDEVLADPRVRVVVVTAPTHLHADMVVAAAQAGKHVYCEKAMAATLRQCRRMIDAADAAGVKLTIGQSTRFQPLILTGKRLIERGDLGRPFAVDGQFTGIAEPRERGATDSWRYAAGSAGNGHVINFGCHYIDTARFLIGADPVAVTAVIENLFSRELVSEDQFRVTSTCTGRALISIGLYSTIAGAGSPVEGYTVYGTEGAMRIGWRGQGITVVRAAGVRETVAVDDDLAEEDGFVRPHRLFREAIERDGPVPVSGEDAMKNVEWGLAAYLSNEQGRRIELPLDAAVADFAGPVRADTVPATR